MAQSSISPSGAIFTETFVAPTIAGVHALMDQRQTTLQAEGHSQFNRRKIGRNSPCPCGSGYKFKKCCVVRSFIPRD